MGTKLEVVLVINKYAWQCEKEIADPLKALARRGFVS
jgi:hypothetical protein